MSKNNEINVKIDVDPKPFEKGIHKVRASMDNMGEGFAKLVKGAAVATFSIGTVYKAVDIYKSSIDSIVSMGNMAEGLGLAVEDFAKISDIAVKSGIDINNFRDSWNEMNKAIAEAENGDKNRLSAFAQLGIDIQKFKSLDPTQQLRTLASAVSNLSDQGQKTRLTALLFGEDGSKSLMPLLQQGADAVDKLADRFDKMGTKIDALQVEKAKEAKIAADNINDAWGNFANTMSVKVAPAVSSVLNSLTALLREDTNKFLNTAPIEDFSKFTIGELEYIEEKAQETADAISSAMQANEAFQGAFINPRLGITADTIFGDQNAKEVEKQAAALERIAAARAEIDKRPNTEAADAAPAPANMAANNAFANMMKDLNGQIAAARRELELLAFPEGLTRDGEAINLQMKDYIELMGLPAGKAQEWAGLQHELLSAHEAARLAKEEELRKERELQASIQARADMLRELSEETIALEREKAQLESLRQKGQYGASIDGINAEYVARMNLASGDAEAEAATDAWYKVAMATNEARLAAEQYQLGFQESMDMVHEGLQGLASPIADAMLNGTTSGLASALAESLKVYAAQKAAHLLMEAAFATTMGIAATLNPYSGYNAGNYFASAAEYAKGAALMGTFAITAGMAHDGMDYIPKEGTWLLDKGERVVDSRTNQDLKGFLANGGAGGVTVNVSIQTSADGKDGVMEALPELEKTIIAAVAGNIMQGGQVKRAIMDYTR